MRRLIDEARALGLRGEGTMDDLRDRGDVKDPEKLGAWLYWHKAKKVKGGPYKGKGKDPKPKKHGNPDVSGVSKYYNNEKAAKHFKGDIKAHMAAVATAATYEYKSPFRKAGAMEDSGIEADEYDNAIQTAVDKGWLRKNKGLSPKGKALLKDLRGKGLGSPAKLFLRPEKLSSPPYPAKKHMDSLPDKEKKSIAKMQADHEDGSKGWRKFHPYSK